MNFAVTRYDTLVEPTELMTGMISNIKSHFRNISENEFIAKTLNAVQLVFARTPFRLPSHFTACLYETQIHKSLYLERYNLIKTFHCKHTLCICACVRECLFQHTASHHIKSSHIQCQNQKRRIHTKEKKSEKCFEPINLCSRNAGKMSMHFSTVFPFRFQHQIQFRHAFYVNICKIFQ